MKDHSVYVEEPDVVELCPWCGEGAVAQSYRPRNWGVGCKNNDCPVMPEAYGTSRPKAITAWNTRASTPPVTDATADFRDAAFSAGYYAATGPVAVDDLEVATAAFVSKACELTGDDQERALLWLKGDTDERSVFEKCIRAALEAIRNRKGEDR